MKVTLQPVSNPEISEITVSDTLFPIGRREEPFASYQSDAVAKLSRRHARIFQEDGKAYIADLGSLNGTQINNQEVHDKATLLQTGDQLTLGGELVFQVNIEQEPDDSGKLDPTRMSRSILLVLLPTDANSILETIVVSQLPFLITRTDSIFGRYKSQFPDDVRQISRRHAVISARGENIFVEDLGSANGTFVDGEKLDERAKLLADGDTIAFGGDRFSYTVRLEITDQEEGATGTVIPGAGTDTRTEAGDKSGATVEPGETVGVFDDSRTTFVNSATSFLDIFLASGDDNDQPEDAESSKAAGRQKGSAERNKNSVFGEIRQALGTDRANRRGRNWITAGIVSALLAAVIGLYLLGDDRREIKDRLDAGNFRGSAAMANRYLEDHADDDQASAWAEEALIKATVPFWIEQIKRGDFETANEHLVATKQEYRFIAGALEMIDILTWAGKVEAYMAHRRGTDTPIVMFRDDESIRTIAEEWNQNTLKYRGLFSQIVTHAPSFADIYARILSDLRTIRSEHALYGKAMAKLRSDIYKALQDEDHEKIRSIIVDFGNKYPRVEGVDTLKQDAEQFEVLASHIAEKNLVQLTVQNRAGRFRTPLFSAYVGDWLQRSLPPAGIIEEYKKARDAWRSGDFDKSIATLKPMISQPWGEVAEKKIERQKKIFNAYMLLADDPANYNDRLLTFRAELDPVEDVYFVQATNKDFNVYKKQILAGLEASYDNAETQWSEYQNAGKISGVIRVEDYVSKKYQAQAARLSAVYEKARESLHAYHRLVIEPPAAWNTLANEVTSEARRQREWLQDLNVVLDPALLKAKLDLLPTLEEQNQ